MKERLLSEFKRLRGVYNRWGGTTAAFFAYTHGSHDQCGGLLVAMLPFIRTNLGLSYMQSGLLLSAYSITAGASQFLGGWLGDRTSRYLVIAIGLCGIGSAALAVGLSSAFYPMLAILVVMGIFAGAYHPSATSMISSYFEVARRGKAIAIHMLGGSFGFTMGPIIGGIIAAALGWRFAYILLCIPALLATVVVLKKFKQWENISSDEPITDATVTDDGLTSASPSRLNLIQVLRPVAFVTILAILTQLIAGSAEAFIPLFLVDKYGIAAAYAAMLMGIIRGGGVVGSLIGGWLSDRWERKNAIALAFVATGPLLFLLTQLPVNLALMVVFVIFGLFMQMRQSTVQPFLMDSTPQYLRATVFGIYFGLSMEGQSLLQPAVGYLIDIFGVIDVFNVIAYVSIALSLVALLLVRRPKSRR